MLKSYTGADLKKPDTLFTALEFLWHQHLMF